MILIFIASALGLLALFGAAVASDSLRQQRIPMGHKMSWGPKGPARP
jgi:hypothetical protein